MPLTAVATGIDTACMRAVVADIADELNAVARGLHQAISMLSASLGASNKVCECMLGE